LIWCSYQGVSVRILAGKVARGLVSSASGPTDRLVFLYVIDGSETRPGSLDSEVQIKTSFGCFNRGSHADNARRGWHELFAFAACHRSDER
jgi:hypothetical protein